MLAALHRLPRVAAVQRERDLPAQLVPEAFQLQRRVDVTSRPEQGDDLAVHADRPRRLARGQDRGADLGVESRPVNPARAGQQLRQPAGVQADQGAAAAGRRDIHAPRRQAGLEHGAARGRGHDDRRAALGEGVSEVVSGAGGQLLVTVVELDDMAVRAQGGGARFARHGAFPVGCQAPAA